MKGRRAALFALGMLALAGLGALGLTLATAAGTIGMGATYDMEPAQVRDFVRAAAYRRGWALQPGADAARLRFRAVLLPWSSATIEAALTPERGGTHVEVSGHARKVKELHAELSARLPALPRP